MNHQIDFTDYAEVQTRGGYYLVPDAGYLRINGPDQLAFLQRQTTNDINLLRAGYSLLTVLTNPSARILDVFYLLAESKNGQPDESPPQGIDLITLPGFVDATYRYLKSRVFFMDKVTITEHHEEYAQVDIIPPSHAPLPGELAQLAELEPDHEVTLTFQNILVRIIHLNSAYGLGYRLISPKAQLQDLLGILQKWNLVEMNDSLYQIFRIEAGIPYAGRELSEEYTPLEVDLSGAVSENKGCYTGQEVIARQITYQKITRMIAGIALDNMVDEGSAIQADGTPVGRLTSITNSPRFGPIGLAVLKRPNDQPGTSLTVGQSNGTVSKLPFADAV